MRRLKRKLRGRGGFTLAELMFSILILLMSTALLAETIRVATDRYFESRRETGAQLLCSSLSAFVEDVLSLAEVSAGGTGISTEAHGLGDNVSFGILSGTDFDAGNNGTKKGVLVATSPNYRNMFSEDPYYYPVGKYAYRPTERRSYDLEAGLKLSWDAAGKYNVTVQIFDTDGALLTESAFSVRPLLVR